MLNSPIKAGYLSAAYRRQPVRTLLPMACDGVGPSATCVNLMSGAHLAGYPVDIFAVRRRISRPLLPIHTSIPGTFAYLPYRWFSEQASREIERQFLDAVQPGDIAYLWPSVSLETHRILNARGIPVVLEGINTRMASAKRILDRAYESFGVKPSHNITNARIAEEEEKYSYASAIFAPSRSVEAALKNSPLEKRILRSSYGVNTTRVLNNRDYANRGRPLTFMFCGFACVRKGVHFLLEAWKQVPPPHKLRLVGRIEPLIAERYADLLASDRVELVGFVKDVHPWFAKADVFVFPSLEEGDPLVTYEAALHGMPIIASQMGAGRLGEIEDTMEVVEPSDVEGLSASIMKLIKNADRRHMIGTKVRRAVGHFDWNDVGARRIAQLEELICGRQISRSHR